MPDLVAVLQVECLVPVRVQSLLDDTGSLCLLSIDGGNGEGVREAWKRTVRYDRYSTGGVERTKHISFVKAIGCDDCIYVSNGGRRMRVRSSTN